MEGINRWKGSFSVRGIGSFLLAGFLTVLVVLPVSLPAQDDRSVSDLYSQAVGEYTEENYKQTHELLRKILRKDSEHSKSRNLLQEVRLKLSGDSPSTISSPDVSTNEGTEASSSPDFRPLDGERRPSSSPKPPQINEEPLETVEHLNQNPDTSQLENPAVQDLVAQQYSDRIRVRIRATSPIGFIGSRIFNPPMIILDLPKTLNRLPDSPLSLDLGQVLRVRHSQYRADPVQTTRVVIDLEEWNERYRVYRSADGRDIVLDVFEDTSSPPPETPMSQRMADLPTEEETQGSQAQLDKVHGDSQVLSLDSEAPKPLVLRVTDRTGDPLRGETVVFQVVEGPGELSGRDFVWDRQVQHRTDPSGFARVEYRSDTQAGKTIVEARVPRHGLNGRYQLVTNPGEAVELVPVSGNRQSTLYGQSVPTPLVVEARDRNGNPVPDVDLKVTDQSGKGMVDLHSDSSGIQNRGTTNHSGRLKVDYYRTAPDMDQNYVRARTYREGSPDLETRFTIFGQPQLISIDFKDANLQDVLRTLAQLADWNIAVTEETGGGELSDMSVTVHLQNVTALRALDTILDVKGLSRVSDGNVMKIVSKEEAVKKGVSVLEPEELEDYPANNIVTVGFKLRYLEASEDLASQLQETLLAEQSSIVADATSNSLVVTDLANNLKRLRKIITNLDRQDQLYEVRVFPLDRRDPKKLSQSLGNLLPTGQGNIVAHRASGTLVVYADPSLMDRVTKVVDRLDTRNPLAENLTVVDVEGFDAQSIAQRINSILGVQVLDVSQLETIDFGDFESSEDLAEFFQNTQEVDIGSLLNSSKVVALPELDKIIVFGPKDLRETARELVDQLKREPGEYIKGREFRWITVHNLPLQKAEDLISRFGSVKIQAGLKARRAFLLSTKNSDTLDRIENLMQEIDRDIDLESNREILVYSPQNLDPEELGDQIDEYLQNLVSEESQPGESVFAELFGLETSSDDDQTRVVYSDENVLVLAVSRWEADFARNLLEKLDENLRNDQQVLTYFPSNSDPEELVTALEENNIGRILYQDENKLTLMVSKDNIERTKEMIRDIDSTDLKTYSYTMQNVTVDDNNVEEMQSIADNMGLNVDFTNDAESNKVFYVTTEKNRDSVRSLIEAFDEPGVSESRSVLNYSPEYVDPQQLASAVNAQNLGQPVLVDDQRVTLLVSSQRRDEIEDILGDIDSPSRTLNVVQLKRRRATDEDFVNNVQPLLENLGFNVNLTAEPKTNSILFTSPKDSSGRIRKMIERLDKWQKQVLIKAVLVEVQLGDDEQVNPEWLINPRSNQNRLTNTGQFDNDGLGLSFNVGQNGEFTALLNSGDFQGALNWIEGNDKTNVVTRPSITALNNQQATLDLSRERYFETVLLDEDNNPTQTQFESQQASRELSVTPTVTESDNVIMDIAISNDVFGQRPASNAPFPKNNRSTENQVMVGNQQTLVLGGIIQSNESYREEKVPYLGDIPLVGNLFRSLNETNERTELIVFITPHVLSTPGDLKEAADNTMGDMRNMDRPSELRSDQDQNDNRTPEFTLDEDEGTDKFEDSTKNTGNSNDTTAISDLQAPEDPSNINTLSQKQLSKPLGSDFAERLVTQRREGGYFESMMDLRRRLDLSEEDVKKLSETYEISVPVINVNQTSEKELARLPGIDDELAGSIVSHRFTQGEFRTLEGLYQVFGMDEETFRTIRPYLRVE